MDKNKIKILDCTLRDGGYYNNWDFDIETVKTYLSSLAKSNIDVVEIGFRSPPANEFMGPYYYSTDSFIENLNIPKNLKIAVMINASDYISEKIITKKLVNKFFSVKKNSPVSIVRIAINFKIYNQAKYLCKLIKDLGYTVGLNLMQAHSKSKEDYIKTSKDICSWGDVDVLYFADSLGSMEPEEVSNIISSLKIEWDGPLGFHAHNNKDLALINTIKASEDGIDFCDSTILGMGRGAGNVATENLLLESSHKGVHNGNIKYFSDVLMKFEKLKSKLNWGPNYYYHFAANNNIHPTYIQILLSENRYSKEEIWQILSSLSKTQSTSYSEIKLNDVINDTYIVGQDGNWDATDWLLGQDVVIIGAGKSVEKYKNEILHYIDTHKPKVFFLNLNKFLPPNIASATIVCHKARFLFEFEKYRKLGHKIIFPRSRFTKEFEYDFDELDILDYGLTVSQGSFEINNKGCKLEKALALPYALSILTQAKAKKISLIGFDGYEYKDNRQKEISKIIYKYKLLNNSIRLESLTPTNYPIEQGSIFSPSSNELSFILIIPARYNSTRFPGKPLADIFGKPMIFRVWEKCVEAVGIDNVMVATESDLIQKFCEDNGIKYKMTSSNCLTGTDRLYEVAKEIKRDIYINVQGDEPLINPKDINIILKNALKMPEKVINGMSKISSHDDFHSPNIPKVVVNPNNELMYMSRAGIPTNKSLSFMQAMKQVCIYAFPINALIKYGQSIEKTPLENIEDIEILRFLELGYKVQMIEVSGSSISVDMPEDLERVKKHWKKNN